MPAPITLQHSLAEIMETWPQTVPFFLKHHMVCVGCQMAKFDTLEEALATYGYPPEPFLRLLNEIARGNRPPSEG